MLSKFHRKRLLLIGNFLSGHGVTPQVCETLCTLFGSNNWSVRTASDKLSKPRRLFDMVKTVIVDRKYYDVAIIDTFSGSAFWFAYFSAIACRFVGKPYILLLHGGKLPEFLDGCFTNTKSFISLILNPHPFFGRTQMIPGRMTFKQAAQVISPSPYLYTELSRRGFDVKQIPNSIDLSIYNFRLRNKCQPRFFWLRSLSDVYNPCLAIQVLSLIRNEFSGVTLTMAGPDRGKLAACMNYAKETGLSDAVRFTGLILKNEVNILAQEHDIFLNTTHADNTPVSVIEAMACGLCVVSTSVGGIPYLLENEVDALLVPPGDAEAMAAAVRRLLTEPELAERLSRNAREKAEQFDWQIILPQWETLLKSLATGG